MSKFITSFKVLMQASVQKTDLLRLSGSGGHVLEGMVFVRDNGVCSRGGLAGGFDTERGGVVEFYLYN